MSTDIDPGHLMPSAILQTADFRDKRILEVGAGDGRLTFQYAQQPSSVVAIDTKEPEIQSAAQSARANVLGHVQFLCASAPALPFPGEQFEIVLLASSL